MTQRTFWAYLLTKFLLHSEFIDQILCTYSFKPLKKFCFERLLNIVHAPRLCDGPCRLHAASRKSPVMHGRDW